LLYQKRSNYFSSTWVN